jgi:hypothetical protein
MSYWTANIMNSSICSYAECFIHHIIAHFYTDLYPNFLLSAANVNLLSSLIWITVVLPTWLRGTLYTLVNLLLLINHRSFSEPVSVCWKQVYLFPRRCEFWNPLYCCSGITLSNSLKLAHLLAMHLVFMILWLYSWHWVFRYWNTENNIIGCCSHVI